MSRPFADRFSDDFREGERDFERHGRPDYSRDKYSSQDEDYFGGFERAQEDQECRDCERREEEYAQEQEEERERQRQQYERQQELEEQQQQENHPNFGDVE